MEPLLLRFKRHKKTFLWTLIPEEKKIEGFVRQGYFRQEVVFDGQVACFPFGTVLNATQDLKHGHGLEKACRGFSLVVVWWVLLKKGALTGYVWTCMMERQVLEVGGGTQPRIGVGLIPFLIISPVDELVHDF